MKTSTIRFIFHRDSPRFFIAFLLHELIYTLPMPEISYVCTSAKAFLVETRMKGKKNLTREIIVDVLVDALKPLEHVRAFWEAGAAAFGRIDDWSDIDLYLIVDETKVDDAFQAVEKALTLLSPVRQKYKVPQLPWPDVFQAFYKLENASEYLLIDLAILTPNSPEKFLEPQTHGKAVFYFNKSGGVQLPNLDKEALVRKLRERLERLRERFDMFNIFVQKEINRSNWLEAVDLYHALTLGSLVETLRIRYKPVHHEFKMRYVHYELPSKITKRLERLYFVENAMDLQEKYHEATRWFHKAISEIDPDDIEKNVEPTRS